MIEVEQRRLWRPDDHPDGPQRGDCVTACLASIFELPYEDCVVDGGSQGVFAWTRQNFRGICARTRVLRPLGDGPERIGDHVNWPTHHHEQGYWMAAIWSPRIPDEEMRGCGCADRTSGAGDPACEWCHGQPSERRLGINWGLHAVVMFNAKLVWDPHPDAAPTTQTMYFDAATTWHVDDPSQIPRRCRKGACGEGLIDPQDCYHRPAA